MISILATDPSFGGSHNVKRALSVLDKTVLICTHPDKWRGRPADTIDAIITAENAKRCAQLVKESRFVFLVGGSAVRVISRLPGYREWTPGLNLVAWATDSYYREQHKEVNSTLKTLGCNQFFILPDSSLLPFVPHNSVPLMHPISLAYEGEKPKRVTIMHSPGTRTKRRQKGSADLEGVIKRLQLDYEFDYVCLMKLPHEECLKQQARAHIFIDKLGFLGVGLGKSGLEAMASGAVVVSALHDTNYTRGFFPAPPVFKVTGKKDLESTLRSLLVRKDLADLGHRSGEWIAQYWGLENEAWLNYFRRFVDL